MSNLIVHEIDCTEGTAVYREATPEEVANITSVSEQPSANNDKFTKLKQAAKQASPELYEFVCYALGVPNDTE